VCTLVHIRQQEEVSDMGKGPEKALPKNEVQGTETGVEKAVGELVALIQRAYSQTTSSQELEELAQALSDQANMVGVNASIRDARNHDDDYDEPVEMGEVLALRFREARTQAGWTQDGIANYMSGIGFGWNRTTVVEIERLRRAIALDEVLALAAVFALPAIHFFTPAENQAVWLPSEWSGDAKRVAQQHLVEQGRAISGADVKELLLGPDGSAGHGGTDWELARRVALVGPHDDRPAVELWNAKDGGE
jgi:transcriptional regulator with XRE-family HTH domain